MWWFVAAVILLFVFWMHYSRAMSDRDRISIALEIVRTARFTPADGFEAAVLEDPTLAGWIKATSGNDCVMLFRPEAGDGQENQALEVIDFASGSFHPSLIIHYQAGKAVQVDARNRLEPSVRSRAEELLKEVRKAMNIEAPISAEYDGCHL